MKTSSGATMGFDKFVGANTPIIILIAYLIFGFILFIFAPFDWHIENGFILNIYFLAIIICSFFGFFISTKNRYYISSPIYYQQLILVGAICSLTLLVPTTLLYSGKYPWQFMDLLANQTDAYIAYQERLRESTVADRGPVALVRSLFLPIIFCVLPLSILHWSRLSLRARLSTVIVVLCSLITSLARGTDRETADLVMISFASWLILYFRNRNDFTVFAKPVLDRTRRVILTVLLIILMAIVFYVFVERKLGRYGGDFTALCVGSEQDICLSSKFLSSGLIGDWGMFALAITAGYMSQGYYGLQLALGLDFQSTLGTGFSPMIARYYEALSGDQVIYLSSYTYRMRALGWSDEYAWSTLMVWFANDVGFIGALLVLFGLSLLFGASWRDAVRGRDDKAAIVFVLLFIMFVYLPANNQIGQSLDLSFAFLFWLYRWRVTRLKA
jgi:hypothetical protein